MSDLKKIFTNIPGGSEALIEYGLIIVGALISTINESNTKKKQAELISDMAAEKVLKALESK